jgi:putrescine transport system ATP-binding protein
MTERRNDRNKHEPWRDPQAEPYIRIEGITKKFGDFVAVSNVSLKIYKGEIFCLLGGSGCGKSTLLRMLAGFEEPSSGQIFLDGQDMAEIPPYERPVNMMFQSYALFPHMTVAKNVAFGLEQERVPKAEIISRVAAILDIVKLTEFALRKPHQLSGGQRQRVALARSLVKRPRVLLLDEPMAALDKKLRGETQFELMDLQRRLGLTFIIVTHDQSEAMTVADRIAVMDRGRLIQVAPPAEIYERPNSRWVADFIGSVNLFEGRVGNDEGTIEGTALGRLRAAGKINAEPGATVWVAVRLEKVRLTRYEVGRHEQAVTENAVAATVVDIGYLGDLSLYRLRTEAGVAVQAAIANTEPLVARGIGWNDKVWLSFAPEAAIVLTR